MHCLNNRSTGGNVCVIMKEETKLLSVIALFHLGHPCVSITTVIATSIEMLDWEQLCKVFGKITNWFIDDLT